MSKELLDIITNLEKYLALVRLEGGDCEVENGINIALQELYWCYRQLALLDVDEEA